MSIPGSAEPLLLAQQDTGGYQIQRSLRFSSIDSAYLSRNVSSETNRKTFTFAAWVKRNKLGSGDYYLFHGVGGSGGLAGYTLLGFSADQLWFNDGFSGAITSTAKFRDPSAWYHVVFAVDSTQATDSNRVKMYVNGVQLTSFSSAAWPSLNRDFTINAAVQHTIGWYFSASNDFLLADVHFIDGQALDPSSFVVTSATTGQLIPKAYTGSFGTNGFWLKFSDNSAATATTLGKDYSGNSNNWTPNNLSVTAGAGNDSLTDTPTSFGTDTGAGGEVRGNYSTLNPLQNATSDTFSNGNLEVVTAASGNYGTHTSTIATPLSGKWYAELTIDAANGLYTTVGLVATNSTFSWTSWPGALNGVCYAAFNGNSYVDTVSNAYGSIFGYPNDVVGIAYDADNGTVKFYLNGVSQGTISNVPVRPYYFGASDYWGVRSCTYTWNFGQRAWTYPANASGFKALCDTNLPAPVVAKPNEVMDVKLWTGNGSTQTISGLGFSPDLVWTKCRSFGLSHIWMDTVRGAGVYLRSNNTGVEESNANVITSFDSTGFTLGSSSAANLSPETFAAWCWDAGTTTSSNGSGSITSSCRTNQSSGFSIVGWTGNGAAASIGHGLNVEPHLIIHKFRGGSSNWSVYTKATGAGGRLKLNTTESFSSDGSFPTTPTSSLFYVNAGSNDNGVTMIAYCFAPVAGYSSFGSYTGNGTQVFVYTGFKPRWILLKTSGPVGGDWFVYDTARDAYNVSTKTLSPNLSGAEVSSSSNKEIDILSNGFLLRADAAGYNNYSGWNYIYAAFAESPFQYARAR